MKFTKEQELQICNDYQNSNFPVSEIAKQNETSSSQINLIIKRNKIPKRNFRIVKIFTNDGILFERSELLTYDENYFEIIDTPEKAYWLGFLLADGHIATRNGVCVSVNLKLSIKEYDHMEKYKQSIKYSGNIKCFEEEFTANGKKYDKYRGKMYGKCMIRIASKKLGNDLIFHGVTPEKSTKCGLPKIEEKLMSHMMRGFILDGDGNWNTDPDGQMAFKFCNMILDLVVEVKKLLIEKCNLDDIGIRKNGNLYEFIFSGNNVCKQLYDYFYGNGGPWLDRKYKYATDHFNNCELKKEIKQEKRDVRRKLQPQLDSIRKKKFYEKIKQKFLEEKNLKIQELNNLTSKTNFLESDEWYKKKEEIENMKLTEWYKQGAKCFN